MWRLPCSQGNAGSPGAICHSYSSPGLQVEGFCTQGNFTQVFFKRCCGAWRGISSLSNIKPLWCSLCLSCGSLWFVWFFVECQGEKFCSILIMFLGWILDLDSPLCPCVQNATEYQPVVWIPLLILGLNTKVHRWADRDWAVPGPGQYRLPVNGEARYINNPSGVSLTPDTGM